ncbi:hypothetical protein AXF42_Ash005779 [Apostasia shenzhenica]|uniref:TsaA-like domain-containing protein n=1 Tax=Apostasia shenzhenica TaxID=1088818 RepID=A0A2I0BCC7_9ASPA|nr:hypothetical protein AXF42_Ash005779 [Apostasia shenzhenica]
MSAAGVCKFPATALAAAVAATAVISLAAAFFSASFYSRRARFLYFRVQELEASLKASVEKAASERRGRVRAQQALREALIRQSSNDPMISASVSASSYPMAPIGFVQSCFATRNGTPRQPLLVPLSRACLVFDPSRVPPDALDGLAEYSYCWVLYIFHLNTDLEKLWRQPSLSKFKAKVRVPRLEGGKMGVLATRSPHRPCPIGLSVAKIEALEGHAVLLSGVDMVDGTPVLDIKPYLPYSDSIEGANVPSWLKEENALAVSSVYFSAGFRSTLSICWSKNENISLYSSIDEFESLIKQVLSWDIRSLSQRSLPRNRDPTLLSVGTVNEDSSSSNDIIYHVILEEVDISYRIDGKSNVIVEKATIVSNACKFSKGHHNYSMWRNRFDNQK